MKDRSITTASNVAARQVGRPQAAGVDLLQIGDPGIGAQLGVELGPAHVEADGGGGPGLQGAVGEAAGGGADIEDMRAPQIEGEMLQGGRQLFAAAADETRRLQRRTAGCRPDTRARACRAAGCRCAPVPAMTRAFAWARLAASPRATSSSSRRSLSISSAGAFAGPATSRWTARRPSRRPGACRCAGPALRGSSGGGRASDPEC